MGAPQEVGVEHEPPDDDDAAGGAKKKTAAEIENEQLKADNERLRKQRDEADEDARYWATRNRRVAADSDDEPEPRRGAAAPVEPPRQMTAEELVEGLNKDGVEALFKAGFLTQAQVDAKLDALREELTGYVQGQRQDAEFNGRIAQEFPTIARESAKVAKDRSYRSADPLFIRTGEIYREMIADDPKLEKSAGTILAAARAASVEIGATQRGKGGKGDDNREQPRGDDGQFSSRREESPARRRDRIERQRPDRGSDDDEARGGGDTFTEEQQAVMKHLNVKADKFVAHRDAGARQESRRGRR